MVTRERIQDCVELSFFSRYERKCADTSWYATRIFCCTHDKGDRVWGHSSPIKFQFSFENMKENMKKDKGNVWGVHVFTVSIFRDSRFFKGGGSRLRFFERGSGGCYVSFVFFWGEGGSLRTQPIAASSRSTIWSGGNGLRWVPPSWIHEYLGF